MSVKNGGLAGNVLRIDLSDRRTELIPTETYSERFVGGLGLACKVAWDEISPEVGALEAGNKLVLAAGPLTGSVVPGSGRLEAMAKSPRTYPRELTTRSGMGGQWGRDLKMTGYDAVILEGESEKPVYVLVTRDKVQFLDAGELWGRDTFTAQKWLRRKHGPAASSVVIGPAGENLCRTATLMSETSFAAGKSGFGAVMGAKKVKALTVVPDGRGFAVARPAELLKLSRHYRDLIGHVPMREWTIGSKPSPEHQAFFDKYRVNNASCFGCSVQCLAYLKVPGVDPCHAGCVNYYYLRPAYEHYGAQSLEADQAHWLAGVLCNQMGLDTFEISGVAPLVRDLFEAGLMDSKTAGFPVDKYGSREFIVGLIEAVAFRRGLGDLLAEGAARAADRLPRAWAFYERYYPAHGQMEHDSVRDYPGIALFWALDSRDPMIDHHAYRHLSVSRPRWPEPHGLTWEQAEAIAEKFLGGREAIDHSTYRAKAAAVAVCQDKSAVKNSLVLCDHLYPLMISQSRADHLGDPSAESRLFSAMTGRDMDEPALDRVGRRIVTLQRAIMVREGRTRDQDTLHQAYFKEERKDLPVSRTPTMRVILSPDHTKPVPMEEFEAAKTEYYRLRGWDQQTGRPTRETLLDLGLPEVAESLVP